MSSINNENLWSKLVSYVFGQMSIKEEKEMDIYLNTHPEAAEFADSLLSYCENEAISNPQMLETKLQNDRAAYQKFKRSSSVRSPLQRLEKSRRWAIAAAILFALGILAWLLMPKANLMDNPGFAEFWETERLNLKTAGDNGLKEWEQAFLAQDFDLMIETVEEMIAENPEKQNRRPLFYLCVVYAWPPYTNVERLEVLLPRLEESVYAEPVREQIRAANVDIDERFLPE